MTAAEVFAALDRAIAAAAPEELPALVGRLVELEERARLRLRAPAAAGNGNGQADGGDRLIDMPEVARLLSVPEEHAREMGRRSELPTVMVGRYVRVREADLREFVATRSTPSVGRRKGLTWR